jgi:TolB protein
MRVHYLLAVAIALSTGCATTPPREPNERIAFLAHDDGFWQVWLIDADGSNARQLTHSPSEKARVSWFPDARALLVDTQDGALLRVDASSGSETPVVLPVHGMYDAAVSPDGRRVSFSLTQSDSPDANELWVCDLDGQNLHELTNRAGLQHQPAWDPRGGPIYYQSDLGPGASHDLWRIMSSGENDERLTFGDLRHLDVAVSSRGEIAYSGNQAGSFDVWLKTPQAEPKRLTDDPALDAHPSFSPDGDAIVFESSREGTLNLWRVARSGGASQRLTSFAAPGARGPAWSPR